MYLNDGIFAPIISLFKLMIGKIPNRPTSRGLYGQAKFLCESNVPATEAQQNKK